VLQLKIFAAVFNMLQEFEAEKQVHRMFTVHSVHAISFARSCPNFVMPNAYGAAVEICIPVEVKGIPTLFNLWQRIDGDVFSCYSTRRCRREYTYDI
jgi:hypothetical protein